MKKIKYQPKRYKPLLECDAELDAKGIDAKVNDIGFQVAKISQRKEARTVGGKKTIITISYAVFNIEESKRRVTSPRVKDKKQDDVKSRKLCIAR